ncbi:hypothetical protein HanRHA438_Chr09g0430121 [Helianthus annuus]|nr:hypothetical protein HanIR_Chr09g0450471 [Helianthus annuus]KAJ0891014.1 hypothetical protein HanRHA438_Chr09g0430121 [Helianthus annuus]KAJ0895765.1 hypothetical protein HanPSC8_Chr09g0404251 [Helianthus annuus]
MMAVRIPYMLPLLCVHHKQPSNCRVLMLGSQHHPPIQIKSNIKLQKVFEDESSGVVCYKDEKGEIICEGYDEGPRLDQQQTCTTSSHPRDREAIVCLLKRSLLLVTEGRCC